jgi:uncharacterized membrane protein
MTNAQKVFLALASLLYIGAGTLHFLQTDTYMKIMPPYVPQPRAMVWFTGVAEITGGIGLLIPPLRRPAAWGLVALLAAVFPANYYMAANHIQVGKTPIPQAFLWARLPLQALLIWWVLRCTQTFAGTTNGAR